MASVWWNRTTYVVTNEITGSEVEFQTEAIARAVVKVMADYRQPASLKRVDVRTEETPIPLDP